jgi:hypothetical protein
MENSPLITLPTELTYRIFDYCDSQTILLHVRRVCKRLYAMVNSYDRFAVILNSNSAWTMKSVSQTLLPEKVISLTVDDFDVGRFTWCDIGTKSFFSLFNGLEFTRLRSLILKHMRDKDLQRLLQSLSCDSLISLSIHSYETKYDQTWIVVLQAIKRWNLQKLCMSYVDYMEKHIPWPDQSSLEHLIIGNCAYSKYLLILHQLPKLRTFVIQNCIMDEKIMPLTSFTSRIHISLKSLTIIRYSLTPEHLELLLSPISSLCHLKLISNMDLFESVFHRSYWEQLNCTKISKIDRFEFFFSYNNNHIHSNFIDFNSLIDPFRTPFWLNEKRWFVAWAYVPRWNETWLYTVPNVIIDQQSPLRFEISSIDNTPRLTARPLNEMIGNTLDQVCKIMFCTTSYPLC